MRPQPTGREFSPKRLLPKKIREAYSTAPQILRSKSKGAVQYSGEAVNIYERKASEY